MADIHCDSSGNDTTGDGSASTPYATIQKCIDEHSSGDKIWIGDTSTYTLSAALDLTGKTKGTFNPFIMVGWDKSAGAGVYGIADIDCDSAIASLFSSSATYLMLVGLKVYDTTGDVINASAEAHIFNCEASGGAVGIIISTESQCVNCYIHDNSSYGISASGNGCFIYRCAVVNNGTAGISEDSPGSAVVASLVIASNGESGIYAQHDTIRIVGSTFVGDGTTSNQSGLKYSGSAEMAVFQDNIITGFSGSGSEGVLVESSGLIYMRGPNVFYDNTSNYEGLAALVSPGTDSTTDPDFVDAASGDYTPQSFADAYLPSFVAGYTTDSNRVMGAVQQAGGGGGVSGHAGSLHSIESGGT